ncbi:MAG: hypothetical protein EKK64_09840 [Neisseriaceae bacterium]|nr:MAG: hypothetical protein EKK64_09840 [Neisseriaceae bacterium]
MQFLDLILSHLEPHEVFLAVVVIVLGAFCSFCVVTIVAMFTKSKVDTPIFKLNVNKEDEK